MRQQQSEHQQPAADDDNNTWKVLCGATYIKFCARQQQLYESSHSKTSLYGAHHTLTFAPGFCSSSNRITGPAAAIWSLTIVRRVTVWRYMGVRRAAAALSTSPIP